MAIVSAATLRQTRTHKVAIDPLHPLHPEDALRSMFSRGKYRRDDFILYGGVTVSMTDPGDTPMGRSGKRYPETTGT